jgi:hypothetical protein
MTLRPERRLGPECCPFRHTRVRIEMSPLHALEATIIDRLEGCASPASCGGGSAM